MGKDIGFLRPGLKLVPGAPQHEVMPRRPEINADPLGPGSAVHRHGASKTRVTALMALHRVRDKLDELVTLQ
jgi:hypothetical protein